LKDEQRTFLDDEAEKRDRSISYILREIVDNEIENREVDERCKVENEN